MNKIAITGLVTIPCRVITVFLEFLPKGGTAEAGRQRDSSELKSPNAIASKN
jgi:hypothetical protein